MAPDHAGPIRSSSRDLELGIGSEFSLVIRLCRRDVNIGSGYFPSWQSKESHLHYGTSKHEERSKDKGRWEGPLVLSWALVLIWRFSFLPVLPPMRHFCIHLRVHFYLLLQKTISSLTRWLVDLTSGWLVSLEIQEIPGPNWGHFPNPPPSFCHVCPLAPLISYHLRGWVLQLPVGLLLPFLSASKVDKCFKYFILFNSYSNPFWGKYC